jgi:hypothetical protein
MTALHKVKQALQRQDAFEAGQKHSTEQSQAQIVIQQIQSEEQPTESQAYAEPKLFEFSQDEIKDIQTALQEEIQTWQFEFLPEHSNGIQVYRIQGKQNLSLPILELSEGLNTKEVEVVEVSDSGSVNDLRVRNHAKIHLLIYEGSLLQGEKQNRIVNATLLLKPESETVIPVSCVEQGRWNKQSFGFSKPNYDATSSMRHRLKRDIMNSKSGHKSNQHNIWSEVSKFAQLEDLSNETADFSDHYEKSKKERHAFKDGLKFNSHGVLARANKADYTDFVGDEKAFATILERVSKGYEFEKEDKSENEKSPEAYLLSIVQSEIKDIYAHSSVGVGHDLRLETPTHFINTLLVEDEFVAISILRKQAEAYFQD